MGAGGARDGADHRADGRPLAGPPPRTHRRGPIAHHGRPRRSGGVAGGALTGAHCTASMIQEAPFRFSVITVGTSRVFWRLPIFGCGDTRLTHFTVAVSAATEI